MPTAPQPPPAAFSNAVERFVLGFEGTTLPEELAALLEQGLAGVALFQRNFTSLVGLRTLTTAIGRAAHRPVLIGIDQEGGSRFALREPFTQWPTPTELGGLNDRALVESMAQAMARELRAVGCNLNFAPMLDLNVNPSSPVTRDRSFGAEPEQVARLGAAFIRGLGQQAVLACAKHYPGHGDTSIDPHADLPVFAGSAKRLDAMELVPFAAAVAEGVPLVMTAHILLPKIDPKRPASLSRRLLTDILRGRLRFTGVILADDLGMGAIAQRLGAGPAAAQAFDAGTDLALLCHDWSSVRPAFEAVERAFVEGQFDQHQWQASRARIEKLRSLAERAGSAPPGLEVVGCAEHRALAEEIRARLARR